MLFFADHPSTGVRDVTAQRLRGGARDWLVAGGHCERRRAMRDEGLQHFARYRAVHKSVSSSDFSNYRAVFS